MANFNWHIESYRKGSAIWQSDYLWRRGQWSHIGDVVASGCGNLPAWCHGDPALFFAASDTYERQNGSACRHLVVTLPRELCLADWISLVEALIAGDLGNKPYQYAIHNKGDDGEEHPHAHILYSDRVPDGLDRAASLFFCRANPKSPELGGCRKDSGGQSPKQLRLAVIGRKKLWQDLQNEALKVRGHSVRVDYRSGESNPNP